MTGSKTIATPATPYLIAAFLVAAVGYAGLLIWLALWVAGQPPDHDGMVDGAFWFILLCAVPIKFLLEWGLKLTNLSGPNRERVARAGFIALLIAVYELPGRDGLWEVSTHFVGVFVIVTTFVFTVDFAADALWSRWKARKSG